MSVAFCQLKQMYWIDLLTVSSGAIYRTGVLLCRKRVGSNRGAYNVEGEQVRGLYHPNGEEDDTIYITASKTRLIEIYTALKAGKKLNRRGKVID